MPKITKAHELLGKAQERQRIGAYAALGALLAEHSEDPAVL